MKLKIILAFLIGFMTGPVVVIYGFGKWTEHKIAQIDNDNEMQFLVRQHEQDQKKFRERFMNQAAGTQ